MFFCMSTLLLMNAFYAGHNKIFQCFFFPLHLMLRRDVQTTILLFCWIKKKRKENMSQLSGEGLSNEDSSWRKPK